MPTNYLYRLGVIATTLILALLLIFGFPPTRLFQPGLTFIQRTQLHPGIDMVGGVSLVYQIEAPPGTPQTGLVESVMAALKRRVDPNGVRNLVWRPEGNNRLEIQMPLSPEAMTAPDIKKKFNDASQQLDATDINSDQVIAVIEHGSPADRAARLNDLAMGSATRQKLFADLSAAYDNYQRLYNAYSATTEPSASLMAASQPSVAAVYDARTHYESLQKQIDATNLSSDTLKAILQESISADSDQQKIGQAKLADLKKQYADFPARQKAMDAMIAQFPDYNSVSEAITGAEDLKHLLQGSGVLEFHILADNITSNQADLDEMDRRLEPGGKGPAPLPGDTIRWMEVDKPSEFDLPGQPPETHEWNGKHYMPVLITDDASMTRFSKLNGKDSGWALTNARRETDPVGMASEVAFEFNPAGRNLFGTLTGHWFRMAQARGGQSRLAIVLDNKVISAPNLQSAITGGNGVITGGGPGGFTTQELEYLINTLNAGSLPAQLSNEPISEQQVGPTLGADNLNRGLIACAFGLVVVAVFLVGYYYIAGIVAFAAVLLNIIIILGALAALGATFTLPSIAGIVLTIGTAVDANVLIFERLREEQHKGLPLRMALRNSYNQAQSAIVDSNMTTVITSLCLYLFGSEEVKGFGLTLLIGICASLFTALYGTKTIFAILIDKRGLKHLGSFPLTFPKWDKALKPNWDWMGKAWIFYTFSIIMISIGLVLFFAKVREGQMMGIEFASGSSVQFELKNSMAQEDVRKLIDAESDAHPQALPSPSVVAVGTDNLHYEVVSPQVDREAVKGAVLEAMKGELKLQLPSTFQQLGADYADARGKSIIPITDAATAVDGFIPPAEADHVGGVIIALRDLSPPLSVQQVKERLDAQRLTASSGLAASIDFAVQAPGDPTAPTSNAYVVAWNPSVSFSADQARWSEDLTQPMWGLVRDAISRPPSFEEENNFDAQVAGRMQQDAFLALFCSIAAIMVYIWIRFGNFKYGTATVVALIHDTVFTLAALGFAHYIAAFWHPNFLEIEPFRIDLTVVAGVLTIMGYSMIDTIVVFDRIRENRGKYGHLDKKVINDAINQTLSRTVLTAGTTIMTVSFMYFLGGEGIHGFTFVLLVGILVGTYSSVAIAAPMLLWGHEKEVAAGNVPMAGLQKTAG